MDDTPAVSQMRPRSLEPERTEAYLRRIGASRPEAPDAEALTRLHLRHLLSVPFENLSVHLRERVILDEQALVDKITRRNRGGFCYELNGAFGALLTSLGYQVSLLSARVHGPRGLGPPFDHAALRVDLDRPYLADVGFGRHSHHPIRLDQSGEQHDPGGTFRIVEVEQGDLDVLRDGEPQYRLELRPRTLRDCEATCWWHQTSPDSHFTKSLVCSLLTGDGRVTLSDRTLIRTRGEEKTEQVIDSDDELLAIYRDEFGITLQTPPTVRSPVG